VVAVNEEEVAADHTEDEALHTEVAVATVRQLTLPEAAIEEVTVQEALQAAEQAILTRVLPTRDNVRGVSYMRSESLQTMNGYQN